MVEHGFAHTATCATLCRQTERPAGQTALKLRERVHVPIYEYRCKKCQQSFELRRRLDDRDKPAACTECGSKRTSRSGVTAFAVIGGVAPDAWGGDGESEDFMGEDDGHGHDHGMPGMGMGGMDMGGDFDF